MGTQLPSLTADGAVTFASAEDFESDWATYIARGALPVRPRRALSPLEQLEVYLLAPGLTTPVPLKVEVVQLGHERALLRLVDPAPAKPVLVARPAAAEVPTLAPPVLEAPLAPVPLVDAPPVEAGPVVVVPMDAPGVAVPAPALPWMPEERPLSTASRTQDLDISGLMPAPEAAPPRTQTRGSVLGPGMATSIELEPVPHSGEFATIEPLSAIADLPPPMFEAPAQGEADASATLSPAALVVPAAASSGSQMPPWFTGDALRFQSTEDLKAARGDLLGVGAVLTIVDGKIPLAVVEVKLAVGAKETRAKTKVTLSPAAPGTAVVQAIERNGFRALVDELEAVTGAFARPNLTGTSGVPNALDVPLPRESTPGPGLPGPRAFSLPKQGQIANPSTAEGILALPLGRTPTDTELATPSVPLLLRWLRTTRGVLRLEVTADDHPVFTAVFVDGREVRTPASLQTLGKSLVLPKMSYSVAELGRPPQMTTSGRTLHLIGETVRALCGLVSVEELARTFPNKAGMCARAVQDVVTGLGLPAQHSRFIKSDVDGSQFLDEIARAAVGGRTVWETLYLLEVYNGIAWDEPASGKKDRTTTGSYERAPVPATADESWAPFEGKDHFQVLGLHWSSSPTEIPPAYQKLRSEYGPGGVKRPSNAQTSEKILKRLEEAYRVLSDPTTRRTYRREKYNLVWTHQAQLLVQKAKLALYRKDFVETQNILLAAEDMAPSEEAKQLLATLRQKG